MHAPNQNLVNGTGITVFDATGNAVNGFAITASVASGENQRTILIGDTGVQGRDFTTVAVGTAVGAGGAACYSESASPPYQMIDCVSWGNLRRLRPRFSRGSRRRARLGDPRRPVAAAKKDAGLRDPARGRRRHQ